MYEYEIGLSPFKDNQGNVVYKITHMFINPNKFEMQQELVK